MPDYADSPGTAEKTGRSIPPGSAQDLRLKGKTKGEIQRLRRVWICIFPCRYCLKGICLGARCCVLVPSCVGVESNMALRIGKTDLCWCQSTGSSVLQFADCMHRVQQVMRECTQRFFEILTVQCLYIRIFMRKPNVSPGVQLPQQGAPCTGQL